MTTLRLRPILSVSNFGRHLHREITVVTAGLAARAAGRPDGLNAKLGSPFWAIGLYMLLTVDYRG